MSIAEDNKATCRRLHDALSTGDLEVVSHVIDEVVEPGAVIHTPLPVAESGAAGLKVVMAKLLGGLPDLQVTIEDMIAEGDKVVCRNRISGTHRGDYLGQAATGRTVKYDEVVIFRIVNGRIAESWAVVDVLTQMKQLGLVPA